MNPLRHLSTQDRLGHTLITGLPRTGRTIFMIDQILHDIRSGRQCIVFDPYGDICDRVIRQSTDTESLMYLDIGNPAYPIGLNILESVTDDNKEQLMTSVITLLYDIFDPQHTGIIGPRIEYAVRMALEIVMYDEAPALSDVQRCFTDKEYLNNLLSRVKDPYISDYWSKQFEHGDLVEAVVRMLRQLFGRKVIQAIVEQKYTTLNVAQYIAERKTLLIDAGRLQDDVDAGMVVTSLLFQHIQQVLAPHCSLKDSFLAMYIDEAAFWPSGQIIKLIRNGVRKNIAVSISTQRLGQLSESLKEELLRSATVVSFRLATADARLLAPEFHGSVSVNDLALLSSFHAYIKSFHDGHAVRGELFNLKKDSPGVHLRDSEQFKEECRKIIRI